MNKTPPVIGVTTSSNTGYFMWLCTKLGVWLAGGKAIRISAANGANHQICDGYIISGGADIDPSYYKQENIASVNIEPERDQLEKLVIEHALTQHKPLLGICRGAQMINIILGGNLYQNVKDTYESFIPTDSMLGKILTRRLIHISSGSKLQNMLQGSSKLYVNSLHHQAIHNAGKNLTIVAKDELGIIQAIESAGANTPHILGVQWHPEFMLYRRFQRNLFNTLIQAAT